MDNFKKKLEDIKDDLLEKGGNLSDKAKDVGEDIKDTTLEKVEDVSKKIKDKLDK